MKASGPAPTITEPASGASEAYRFALSSLRFALEAVRGRSVLVTSVAAGDGKTVAALNLAVVAAHNGLSALLVDADERVRGLTRLADLEAQPGVSNLDDPGSIQRFAQRWVLADGTQIDIVPAGTGLSGSALSILSPPKFRKVLPGLLEGRDIVIIDSAPAMAAAETADLAATVDAIVLVVAEGTSLNTLADARHRLNMSGTPIVGYIFNRATQKSAASDYGYGYGYGHGYGHGFGEKT